MTTKTEKIEEKVPTKLERATKIKDELMKEGVHYGKIQGATSDFLWLSGASLLADEFEIDGVMSDVSEIQVDGQSQITVTIDMLDRNTADRHCVGVGTWDSGEMLGNRQGARQRGIAMAYKRAYVLGIRYATSSHGLFSQDDDLVSSNNAAHVVIDSETGEKKTIPVEMYERESDKALVFKSFKQGKDQSINEILAWEEKDRDGTPRGISYLLWIRDKAENTSSELKSLITDALNNYAPKTEEKPDTPDLDSIAESRADKWL